MLGRQSQALRWESAPGAASLTCAKELGFATAARLDNSDDVKELREKLKSINANLRDDVNRLKKIATYAAIAAQIADGLTKLAEQVAGAVAKA